LYYGDNVVDDNVDDDDDDTKTLNCNIT